MVKQPSLSDIRTLLDIASRFADERSVDEPLSTHPFTMLAQSIDYALARADNMLAEGLQ